MKAPRAKVVIHPKDYTTVMPWDYKRILSASIWRGIITEAKGELRRGVLALHNDPNLPSAFTFSNIFAESSKGTKKGIIAEGDLTFYFTTPIKELMDLFVQALENGNFHPRFLKIENIDVKVQKIPVKPKMKLKTLSEVLVRAKTDLGRRDLYPTNPLFTKLIKSNLARKYYYINGDVPGDWLKIDVEWFKPKRYDYGKLGKYRVSYMGLTLEGPKDLIAVALTSGIGHKNALGFGMLTPREDEDLHGGGYL
ncbi:CRISPR-associated endoribonuclease Cas6 [Pyrococcus kukulkanii]|uniref:CRISPR-associated endoribonuclease Cas6 n=1 Tax=Pyrococcus kukulkanii TaxID=1609559 RepID=UPI0035682FBF